MREGSKLWFVPDENDPGFFLGMHNVTPSFFFLFCGDKSKADTQLIPSWSHSQLNADFRTIRKQAFSAIVQWEKRGPSQSIIKKKKKNHEMKSQLVGLVCVFFFKKGPNEHFN